MLRRPPTAFTLKPSDVTELSQHLTNKKQQQESLNSNQAKGLIDNVKAGEGKVAGGDLLLEREQRERREREERGQANRIGL